MRSTDGTVHHPRATHNHPAPTPRVTYYHAIERITQGSDLQHKSPQGHTRQYKVPKQKKHAERCIGSAQLSPLERHLIGQSLQHTQPRNSHDSSTQSIYEINTIYAFEFRVYMEENSTDACEKRSQGKSRRWVEGGAIRNSFTFIRPLHVSLHFTTINATEQRCIT